MVLRSQVRRIAIAVETTEGTAMTITAANWVNHLVDDMARTTMVELDSRKPHRSSYSDRPGTVGIRNYGTTFSLKMKGDGTAGVAPPFSTFLTACGMSETNIAAATTDTAIAADDNSDDDGLTVASSGTFGGTYVEAYLVKITTGGALDGTAKCSVTELFSYDTDTTNNGITTGVAINLENGGAGMKITFTKGSGTLTAGDRWLVWGCPASVKKYLPTTSLSSNSYTLFDSIDGMRSISAGCRGNVEFILEAGKPGIASFDFSGSYAAPTTTAMPSPTDTNTQIPPAFLNAKVSIDGYEASVQRISFNLGNVLAPDTSANTSGGVLSYPITNRGATGTITLRRTTPSTNDYWGDLIGGAPLFLSAQLGSTKGNMFQFIAQIQYTGAGEQDDNGIASLEVPFELVTNDNTKEEELTIFAL